jgi:Fe-S cluster assembly protein SufD
MLIIDQPGTYQLTERQVTIKAQGSVNLIIANNLELHSDVQGKLNLNLISEAKEAISITHHSQVAGELVLTHAFLQPLGVKLLMKANLIQPQASIKGISASVASHSKQYRFEVNHQAPLTTSNIENYAVVLNEGTFYCDTIGKINQGYPECKAYQTTRVLTTTAINDIKVLPILAIDENNVQAKHACTIGKLDQEQLYYLQSRGLDLAQALQLIIRGYLSSVLQVIEDETILDAVKASIERQVTWICSM